MSALEEIDLDTSGTMLWITEPDGKMHILGGDGENANILVWTDEGEASIDLSPESAAAAARCLMRYAGRDVVFVDRRELKALMMASAGAEAVLDVLNLGKPLRLALQRFRSAVAQGVI